MPPASRKKSKMRKTRKTKRGGAFWSSKKNVSKVKDVETIIKLNDKRLHTLIDKFDDIFNDFCLKVVIGVWARPEGDKIMLRHTNVDNLLDKYKALEYVYKKRDIIYRDSFDPPPNNATDPEEFCRFNLDKFMDKYDEINTLIEKLIRNELRELPENEVGPNGRELKKMSHNRNAI